MAVVHHNVTFLIDEVLYEDNLKWESIYFAVLLNFLNKPDRQCMAEWST